MSHTAYVTEDGALYTWGRGNCGKLGHGHDSGTNLPTPVKGALLGARVMQMAASKDHTACVTEHGTLYTWGMGGNGQLGDGNNSNTNKPTLVQGALAGSWVVQVSAGSRHTACVTKRGAVYTWGKGTGGRLGHGSNADTRVPTVVQGVTRVKHVSAGDAHTACVTEALCTWGGPNPDPNRYDYLTAHRWVWDS